MPRSATRVLVADEQRLLVWALERTLTASGLETVSAASRTEVCSRLAGEHFDAIVLASEMSESDMSDLIVEIDRQQPGVRLVVLCRSDNAARLRARLAGGVVYEAPFNIDQVALAVVEPSTGAPVMQA